MLLLHIQIYLFMGTCETCVPAQENTHEMQTQSKNKTLTLTAKEAEHLSYKTFPEFMNTLRQEIEENQKIYKPFIPHSALLKVISEFKKRYFDHQSCKELIALVIDFLSYCKNQSGCEPKLQTTFTQEFSEQFASRWQRIRQNVYFANKGHLRILSFIVQSPSGRQSNQGGHFQQYKMDLSQQSCEKLADIGLQMCQQHTGSFAFLTNFLWGSCIHLYNQGTSIQQIQIKYNKILEILCNKYRPAPQINSKNELDIHSLEKQEQFIPKIKIDLRGRTNKEQFLNNCIMERAEEAKQKYDEFYKFVYQICKKNDGFHFKSKLKIKKRSENKALMSIKEEILKEIYSQHLLQYRMGKSRLRKNDKKSLNEMVEDQLRQYKQKMQQILDNLRQPIQFKVSDMLKCTCSFSVVEKINQCCNDIQDALKTDKYKHLKLIEIDNRLKKGTSDLILKILFGNVITEIQFVVDLNALQNAFSNMLHKLQRSQFFTPLTQLSIMNDNISNSYFTEAKAYIDGNTKRDKQDYDQSTTFKQVSKVFDQFVKNLPSKVELDQIYEGSIDLTLMKEQFDRFNLLVKANNKGGQAQRSKWQSKYIEGEYCYEMKQYEKSKAFLNEALQEVVTQSRLLPHSQEKMKQKLIKGQIKIMKKLGDTQKDSGNYILALEYYKNCLQIEERVKGEGSIEASSTLGSIGLVYFNQGQYPKALEAYKQSLQIKEKVKGKGSIDTVLTLGNMGLAYANQGDYPKALQCYKQSLSIKERVKGKGNIDTAATLNNIGNLYRKQSDYFNAYPLFQQSLSIYKKYGKTQATMVAKNLSICYKALNYVQKRQKLIKQYNLSSN